MNRFLRRYNADLFSRFVQHHLFGVTLPCCISSHRSSTISYLAIPCLSSSARTNFPLVTWPYHVASTCASRPPSGALPYLALVISSHKSSIISCFALPSPASSGRTGRPTSAAWPPGCQGWGSIASASSPWAEHRWIWGYPRAQSQAAGDGYKQCCKSSCALKTTQNISLAILKRTGQTYS